MNMVNSRTPQGGLGFTNVPSTDSGFNLTDMATDLIPGGDIVSGIFNFATSLFKKDHDKVEYDRCRQKVWDSICIMFAEMEL